MRFILLLLILLPLSGCRHRDIEDYSLILGISIDADEAGLLMNFEIFENEDKSYVVEIKGKSINDCFDKLDKVNSTIPYLNHCSIVVIGEEYAKKGIMPLIEYILHDPDFRMTCYFCVCEGKAKDILNFKSEGHKGISNDLTMGFDLGFNKTDIVDKIPVYKIADSILFSGSVLIPTCRIEDKNINISGGALFYKDKLDSFLDKGTINSVKMIRGKLKEGLLTLDGIDLSIDKANVKKKYSKKKISISIELEVIIYDYADWDDLNERTKRASEAYKKEMVSALSLLQKKGMDPFSFKEMIYRHNCSLFMKINESYLDFYQNTVFDVSVELTPKTSGYAYGL